MADIKAFCARRHWNTQEFSPADAQPGIYIYAENEGEKTRKSLLCLVRLEAPDTGVIDFDAADGEAQVCFASLKDKTAQDLPVCAVYTDEDGETTRRLDRLTTGAPCYTETQGAICRSLWVVNDQMALEAFRAAFSARRLTVTGNAAQYGGALYYRDFCRKSAVFAPGSEFVFMQLTESGVDAPLHPANLLRFDLFENRAL